MRYYIYILLASCILSQSWYNHPELVWKTYETEHFIFHYHEGTENTVSEAAKVAERIYKPITDYYDFRPKNKTTIVIKDTDDFANGTAYYYDNKLEIWALPLDFDLRGSHRWLQNVITHEFTHIIQIGKSMKASTRIPAFYFQGFSYEKEKRDDVLYGFPNIMFSIPVPGVAVPPWLAEGTAQYMDPTSSYDFWDSHRDMLLRDLAINDKLLSLDEMNTFGKKGIGSEAVYNQGFSFSNYLVEEFGQEILPNISNILSSATYSVNKAIQKATGYSGYDLYSKWVLNLKNNYNQKLSNVKDNNVEGIIIEGNGTTNLYPKWSPDGSRIAFLSNKENDYFGQTDLFIYDLKDSISKKVISGARHAPAWINDSVLVFSMRSAPDKNGSKFFDLYQITVSELEDNYFESNQDQLIRLTKGSRLRSPSYNSENNLIAAISTIDGQSNIFISEFNYKTQSFSYPNESFTDFKQLTNFSNQEYIGTLNWDDDGNLLMDVIVDHGRDIYKFDIKTKTVSKLIDTDNDVRNPVFYKNKIYVSQDYNGIFNISSINNGENNFFTNTIGSAFMPDFNNEKLVFSVYDDGGYKISIINNLTEIPIESIGYINHTKPAMSDMDYAEKMDISNNNIDYDDHMSELHIVPRVMIDYNTTKYGLYAFSDDMIGNLSLFSGFSINRIKDVDLFLMFDYKKFKPTLFFNFYWATRHTKQSFDYFDINGQLIPNITINNDVDYQIFSSDIGIRFPSKKHKIWLSYEYNNYKQNIFQFAYQDFTSNGEEQTIAAFGKIGFDYFQSHNLSIRILNRKIKPHFLGNMLPNNGNIYDLKVSYEFNYFMDGFSLDEEYGTYGSVLKPNHTPRVEFDFYSFNHINRNIFIELSTKLGLVSNDIDDFFHFFGGGLTGIKGYTFYDSSLTGSAIWINSVSARKLLLDKNYFNFKDFMTFNKLSLGLIAQCGSAYDKDFDAFLDDFKLSSGLEFRAKGYLFYGYPLALSIEHHFAIADKSETKGKSYIKLLFDF